MSIQCDNEDTHDPHYEPIISLPEKVVAPLEENEEILFKMRAKLFRFSKEADPPEWKERGTGDVKILKHKTTSRIRILMRRDKTFKICANHYLEKHMELVPNCNSDRAWMWTTFADFSEQEPKEELLAIRFLNAENANKFKDKFVECQNELSDSFTEEADAQKEADENNCSDSDKENDSNADKVAEKLEELTVKEGDKTAAKQSNENDKPEINSDDKNSEK